MQKTLKSPDYARLINVLVAARHRAGLTQRKLAERLEEHQSFVAKYENGERRLDIIEFVAIARAVGADPVKLFRDYVAGKGTAKSASKRPSK
jgi:transcriptional regulator with XRE-family HTH domain